MPNRFWNLAKRSAPQSETTQDPESLEQAALVTPTPRPTSLTNDGRLTGGPSPASR